MNSRFVFEMCLANKVKMKISSGVVNGPYKEQCCKAGGRWKIGL